jgi:hypothetical protein
MDFIQLQRIDYRSAFCCGCGGNDGVSGMRLTADGITIGHHTMRSFQEQPCTASTAGQPVYGSTFTERLLVQSKPLREQLLQFAGSEETAGLSAADYDSMLAQFESAGPDVSTLAFLLRQTRAGKAGRLRASQTNRDILYTFGTGSPASQLLPACCQAAAAVLAASGVCDLQQMRKLYAWSPVLHAFIKRSTDHIDNVKAFMTTLVKVRLHTLID